MKNFCEIINCNNEAKITCISCQKHICDNHRKKDGLWYIFDPYASDFWTFRAILYTYRQNFNVPGMWWLVNSDRWALPKERCYYESIRYKRHEYPCWTTKGTYRFFYEQVLPKVRLPEKEKYSLREPLEFCEKCFENHVRIINDKLDKDFFPAVRNVQKSDFICGIHDTCLVDVSNNSHICGNCSRQCCPYHGLKCSACGIIFCTDDYYLKDVSKSDYSSDYRCMALGGCAEKHNHFFRSNNYKTLI